ncbi:MAG: head decoration protein [Alphaproteobacteria bacterium]|nr:head decoration protein [Alphaproteobacteria bacterium]
MTEVTEGQHKAEFLVTEGEGTISRETATVLAGQNLKAGHVLGKVSIGAASGAAVSGNTGDGTISSVSVGTGAKVGDYKITCIEPATGAGTFSVEDPDGVTIGSADVGTAFAGEINFTLTAGSTDFAAGDAFTVTVAAGSGKYKEYNPANTDGSQTPVAILLDNVDATDGDKEAVIVSRHAEVNEVELVWFTGATDVQKAVALSEFRKQVILARAAV